jgi:PAS domain S-box-containing protein
MSLYDPIHFAEQISSLQHRLDELVLQAAPTNGTVPAESLSALRVAIEELRTAEEELFVQAEELSAAQAEAVNEWRRYQDLFNFSPDGYLTTDLNGVIRESNQMAATMLGVPARHLVGKSLPIYVAETNRLGFRDLVSALHAGQPAATYEAVLAPRVGPPLSIEFLVVVEATANPSVRELRWCLRDVSARRRAEDELQSALADLRRLAERVETLREEEQGRLARQVHDDLGGLLTAIKIDLVRLRRDLVPIADEARLGRLSETIQTVDTAMHTARGIATELRPAVLDTLGLTAAMEWSLDQFQDRAGVTVHFDAAPGQDELPTEVVTALYRVFQELLLNVAKHAQAARVEVRLARAAEHVLLEVQDDGVGITPAQAINFTSIGLLGCRERLRQVHGTLDLTRLPAGGTLATVRVTHLPPASPSSD